MVKKIIFMNLKRFIKDNAVSLIFSFFCLGVFIGLSGSVALILLSFFIGIYFGQKIQVGNSKNQFMRQAQELIIGEIPLIKSRNKRKRVQ